MEGIFNNHIDAKGRIFIPPKMRDELGASFYVAISNEDCLTAYSEEAWGIRRAKMDALSTINQKRLRPLFAHSAKVELDTQGRILLPQALRDEKGLVKNVTVVGVGSHAEFWDTDVWNKIDANEKNPENLTAVLEEIDF